MNPVKFLYVLVFLGITSFYSCKRSPQPIMYGKDACHFCRMTIVDKIHGAEIITDKGKVFKFDAAECLIRYHNDLESTEGYMLLTNHFEMPEALMPINEATFLISEEMPSPMGAFVTAFKTDTKASELKEEKGGELYNWEDLQLQLTQ